MPSHTIQHIPLAPGSYVCYVIANADFTRTYAGMTNHFGRRIRQHEGHLRGGAKATRSFGKCHLLFYVEGFGTDKRAALRAEWRLKEHRGWRVSRSGTTPQTRSLVQRHRLLAKMMEWASHSLQPNGEMALRVVYTLT
jgi:predicted GIY-YIG superfamily endonuclease